MTEGKSLRSSLRRRTKIAAYFDKHLQDSMKPTLDDCREFLCLFPMERTPKNLQDKIRNMIGW